MAERGARVLVLALALVACGGGEGSVASSAGGDPRPPVVAPPGNEPAAPPVVDVPTPPPPAASATDYDVDGPLAVTTSEHAVTTGSRSFTLHAWAPSAPGARPVVSLSPGLLQRAEAYAPFARRLASHGIVTVVRDDPGALTPTPDVAADVAYVVMTWLATGPLAAQVDRAKVGLAGHSRGGKATLMAAEGALAGKVRGWFGLDPVDAKLLNGGVQVRDALASLTIPTAYLGASVASSCSPAGDGADVLFDLTPSPSVKITGLGAGHTQLQDPSSCTACAACAPAGTADGGKVLAYAVRYLTAFFARELAGDASVGPAFEGARAASDVAAGLVSIASK